MDPELRERMIEALIDADIEANGTDVFLRETLRQGHQGYENMSDEELVALAEAVSLEVEGWP